MPNQIQVIYEDKDYLIISKPAGVLVHKPKTHTALEETVVDWLYRNRPEISGVGDDPLERPGIVHRLDKETSGVLVIAKNNKTFEYLKGLFQTGKMTKTYLALVWGKLSGSGRIDKPIGLRSGTTRRSVRVKDMKMIKEAVTEYKALKIFELKVDKRDENLTLLRVFPKTGRTHQIRVHLASVGHAVVGDVLYGPKRKIADLSRQFLHAESIEFVTSAGSRLKIEAELPKELKLFLASVKKMSPRG